MTVSRVLCCSALAASALSGLACEIASAPEIILTSPSNGDRVRGTIVLTAALPSTAGVQRVEFVVDAVTVGTAISAPYTVSWDSSRFVGRNVKVVAVARMASGASSISSPAAIAIASAGAPLPFGKESMYTIINEGVLERADELLQDVWDIGPRSKPVYLNPVTWTEDPYDDAYWRLIFYSLRPTTNLLWAYYTTGNVAYRDKLVQILESFTAYDKVRKDNAYFADLGSDAGLGIVADDGGFQTFDEDYASAFRSMVLANTYWKLKRSGDLPAQLDSDLRLAISKIGDKLASPGGYTGNFGNHGFTSAASLLLLAENFPDLALPGQTEPIAPVWKRVGSEELTNLIANAVDADGVEVENSPFYHFYVMTFAQQIATWAGQWHVSLPDQFIRQTDAMSAYAAYILQPDLLVPLLGSSVTTGLANVDPGVVAAASERDLEFAYVASSGKSGTEPMQRSRLFIESGQSMLRSGFGSPADLGAQTFMTFNVGPWRSPHCHFDVLGLTYYSSGRRLLTDSGLFSYTPSADHDFFYGTRAHNTVAVDGQDQGQAQVVLAGLTATGPDWAYQSGSHGLYAGVTHRRAVLLLRQDFALIVDQLTSAASHDYAQTWHFAPELQVAMNGLEADASDQVSGAPLLSLVQGLVTNVTATTIKGATQPIQGWFSEKYGVKVPNVALEYRQTAPSASFVTLIASGDFAGTRPLVTVIQDDTSAVRVRVCAGSVWEDVEIDGLMTKSEAVSVTPSTAGCE